MDILWSSVELTRAIFLIGAVFALLYKKRFGVTPGGIIVPGILACTLFASFTAFLVTLFTAAICYFLYQFTFGRFALDRRWSALILITMSTLIGLAEMWMLDSVSWLNQDLLLMTLVVPGLIAISARRYTLSKVALGMLSVTAVSYLIGWLLISIVPYGMATQLSVELSGYRQLSLDNPYFVIPLSLLISVLIYYRFGIRGGGYLIAPFIAAVTFSSPIQTLMLIIGIGLSYGLVKLALRFTLIIGLERFLLSLFCACAVVTFMDIIATMFAIPNYRPSALILIIAVAVCTNDLSIQSLKSSLKNGFGTSQAIAHLARWAV